MTAGRAWILFAALAAGCGGQSPGPRASAGGAPPASTARPPAAAPRPPVVVALVVDQLAAWQAIERWPTLPASGGFAKLIRESGASAILRYPYAHNATAMGHSSLFTGAVPHDSGIVANGKLAGQGQYLSFFSDDATKVVTGGGVAERAGSSLRALLVPTVADALREAHPDALVMAFSMKDRGALFGGGKQPDAVLWFDAKADAFVTSTAFATSTPAWASAFTEIGAGARYRTKPWSPLDPRWLEARHLEGGDLGQGDFHHLGATFPHDLEKADPAPKAFIATPFADAMLLDLATRAADEAAKMNRPTLLAVSLSSTDYVGHVFGPDAPEAWDQMLRLDALLGRFLDHLDATFGKDGYAVVLSSDHGVPPTPEVMKARFCGQTTADPFERRCTTPVRLFENELGKTAQAAAERAAGKGSWVLGGNEPYVELSQAARDLPPKKRDALIDAVAKALDDLPGVLRVYPALRVPEVCPPLADESLDALVCRSVRRGASGDFFLVMEQGSFIDTNYVEGDGVNHGTHWLFDRTVPIVSRPARAPAKGRSGALDTGRTVDHRAYAATLAALLGVDPPAAARGGAVLGLAER
ncbi:MAG: alkaline phosphatase family protein [Myxococcales bacterium]|nr:alkaline phosphatase family protein [Myxococcales bacterium]